MMNTEFHPEEPTDAEWVDILIDNAGGLPPVDPTDPGPHRPQMRDRDGSVLDVRWFPGR